MYTNKQNLLIYNIGKVDLDKYFSEKCLWYVYEL